jgi:hypothetical protein
MCICVFLTTKQQTWIIYEFTVAVHRNFTINQENLEHICHKKKSELHNKACPILLLANYNVSRMGSAERPWGIGAFQSPASKSRHVSLSWPTRTRCPVVQLCFDQ